MPLYAKSNFDFGLFERDGMILDLCALWTVNIFTVGDNATSFSLLLMNTKLLDTPNKKWRIVLNLLNIY